MIFIQFRLYCLSIYIRNITYWTTVIQRIKKNEKSPFCSSKRTVCCFGKGIQLNLLTLIQVSAILSGNQSGNQSGKPAWSVQSYLLSRLSQNSECPDGCSQRNSSVLNPILALFVVDSSGKRIVEAATATYLEIQFRNTKVVHIALFCVNHICCYYCY